MAVGLDTLMTEARAALIAGVAPIHAQCGENCKPIKMVFQNWKSKTAPGRSKPTWHCDVLAQYCCKCKPPTPCDTCDYDGSGAGNKTECLSVGVDTEVEVGADVAAALAAGVAAAAGGRTWNFQWCPKP